VLLHDLSSEQFADMYAQTIAYGLFAARVNMPARGGFTREQAAYELPKTNPFLRKMFTYLAGPDLDSRIEWAVDDMAAGDGWPPAASFNLVASLVAVPPASWRLRRTQPDSGG